MRSLRKILFLVGLSAALAVLSPAAVATAAGSCVAPGQSNYFAGMGQGEDGYQIDGVRAVIDWANPDLCIQGGTTRQSWSLSWISLDGPQPDVPGVNIFQGGFAKCPPPSIGSCPYNSGVSYYWYFYGHKQGPCGAAFNTGIRKTIKGNASAGSLIYRISWVSDVIAPGWGFFIDGDEQVRRYVDDLTTCWNSSGIAAAEWQNEMLNPGDENGGTASNKQFYTNARYRKESGTWVDIDRVLGDPCDANSSPANWGCLVSSGDHNSFKEWDKR